MRHYLWTVLALTWSTLGLSHAHAQNADDSFLETGWIVWDPDNPYGNTYFSTYDFASYEANGVEVVEVRRWSDSGTLGWTSSPSYFFVYQTDGTNIFMRSADGATDNHTIVEWGGDYMRTVSSVGNHLWVSCAGAFTHPNTWLNLAFDSTRSCAR